MLTGKDSRSVAQWLERELGATFQRQTKHGRLYLRTCPLCKRQLRILVPPNRERLLPGTFGSILRSAHITALGLPDCPSDP